MARISATSLLFTAPGGAALHRSSFSAVAWKPALRGTGLPCSRENGMHALRHLFASALLARGVDIRALAAYLGHHDPGFTLRVYCHLMPSSEDRMRQAVDAVFASSDGPETARQGSGEHRHLGHLPPGTHASAGRSRAGA